MLTPKIEAVSIEIADSTIMSHFQFFKRLQIAFTAGFILYTCAFTSVLSIVVISSFANAEPESKNRVPHKQSNTMRSKVLVQNEAPARGRGLNVRIFPLNFYSSSIHAATEYQIAPRWAVGLEASVMPKFQDIGNYFVGKPDYGWQEHYVGGLGQFFVSDRMIGLFLEAGLNYLAAEIRYEVLRPNGLPDQSISKSGSYLMPHASINYRFGSLKGGLNMTTGLGFYSLIGESLMVPGHYGEGLVPSDYTTSTRLRLRIDVGYIF